MVNPYFDHYAASEEQDLLDDLIVESIGIYGLPCYYLPRTLVNFDKIYGEDDQSAYNEAIPLDLYVKSVDGFLGQQDFISKFSGVTINDQVIWEVARTTFTEEITSIHSDIVRPREGDLIYFPLNKKCFQITFADKFDMFYQLGALYLWSLTTELFQYSNETFNTGIADIDKLQKNYSINSFDYAIMTEDGYMLTNENGDVITTEQYNLTTIEPLVDNDELNKKITEYVDWSKVDPTSDYGYIGKAT